MRHILIEMQLMGKICISVNGQEVVWKTKRVGKLWNVLCLLAVNNGEWVPTQQMAQLLWGGKEAGKTRNDVKSAVSQLRRELTAGTDIDRASVIEYGKGGYRLGQLVELSADFDKVKQACRQLESRTLVRRSMSLYRRLARLYTGDFFHGDGCSPWMQQYADSLWDAYVTHMTDACRALWQQNQYEDILALYRTAKQAFMPCDALAVHYYRALHALGQREEIIQEYNYTESCYVQSEREDCAAMEEIGSIMLLARQNRRKNVNVLDAVSSEILPRQLHRVREVPYSQLRSIWRENPGRYAVASFTFLPARGGESSLEELHSAMEMLKQVAKGSLRGHDIISPYSDNQMLVVLPNHSLDTGQLVRDRLYSRLMERVDASRITVSAEAKAF